MSVAGLPAAVASPGRDAAWTGALWVLAAALCLTGFLFRQEALAAVVTWDRSTAYNHCWLVLPISAWLAWTRRHRLIGLRPEPSALLALPAIGFALAWLVAERLGIMEGRQLAALGIMVVLVFAILGWRVGRAMAAPLAYLVFLVPFGAFLVPQLQVVTAEIILFGLRLFAIPHFADGLIIEIPAGTFLVAEACAGLRFIIASLAFGALYALVMFQSPGRRLVVMVLAVVVPVLANGLRALGIVLLGHHLGSAEAAAADHIIYGWGFFSVVILLLVLAGLPFRQDGPDRFKAPVVRPRPGSDFRAARLLAAAALPLLMGGSALALASWASAAGAAGMSPVAAHLIAPPGCTVGPGQDILRCGDAVVSVRLLSFSSRVTWAAVAAQRNRATGEDDEAAVFTVATEGASWQVRRNRGSAETVAVAAWLDGRPAGDGLRSRALQAWNGVRGGHGRPVLGVVSLRALAPPRDNPGEQRERALMRQVLEAQAAGLTRQAASLSRDR